MSAGCVIVGLVLALALIEQIRQSFRRPPAVRPALAAVPLGRLALHFANGVALLAGVIGVMAVLGGLGGTVAAIAAPGMSGRWLAAGISASVLTIGWSVLWGVHHVQIGVRDDPARIGRGLAWIGASLVGLAAPAAAGVLPDVFRSAAEDGWGTATTIAIAFAGAPLFVALVVAAIYGAFRETYLALDAAMRDSASRDSGVAPMVPPESR